MLSKYIVKGRILLIAVADKIKIRNTFTILNL
jgi:hypothetical protein